MSQQIMTRCTAALAFVTLASVPALAHHPMGGAKVTTFSQGLLSGLGHPILGLDHLVFLLALGALTALVAGGVRVIAAFMVASFAGVVLHLAQIGLPFVEPALAVSVLAAGLLLLAGGLPASAAVLILGVVGGVLHGYALAESIVGVERTPLAAYLVGLTIVQATMMVVARLVASLIFDPEAVRMQEATHTRRVRLAGGAVSLAGAAFLAVAVSAA